MKQLQISREARQDLRNILLFTRRRWGQRQAAIYRGRIDGAFDAICLMPAIGQRRVQSPPRYRWYRVSSHWIGYEVVGDAVVVQAVLHIRQSMAERFSSGEGP